MDIQLTEVIISLLIGTLLFLIVNKICRVEYCGGIKVKVLLILEWIVFVGIIFIMIIGMKLIMNRSEDINTNTISRQNKEINDDSNYIEEGKKLIQEKDYDRAIEMFSKELEKNPQNNEGISLKNMLVTYNNAKSLYDQGVYEKAKAEISRTDGIYNNYDYFKQDVNYLISQIDTKINKNIEITNSINKIITLVNEKKYNKAKILVEKLNKSELNEAQIGKINELESAINTGINNESKAVKDKIVMKSKDIDKSKGKYYVPKLDEYANSIDELIELYNKHIELFTPPNGAGVDYIDTETQKENWINPASTKADGFNE